MSAQVLAKWSARFLFILRKKRQFPVGDIITQVFFFNLNPLYLLFLLAAILDDPMECSRGERLAITLAKDSINRNTNRSTTGKLEVDIFELLRDSEYEMGETSK